MEFLPVWSTLRSSTLPADRFSTHALPPCIFFFSFDVLILFSFHNKNNCSESPSYDYQARTPPITTKSDTLSRNILPSLSASSSIEYQPDLKRRSYSLEDYRVKIPSMMDLTFLNSIPPVKKQRSSLPEQILPKQECKICPSNSEDKITLSSRAPFSLPPSKEMPTKPGLNSFARSNDPHADDPRISTTSTCTLFHKRVPPVSIDSTKSLSYYGSSTRGQNRLTIR